MSITGELTDSKVLDSQVNLDTIWPVTALALQGIPVAPTFRPTPEEFMDPLAYIEKIKPEGEK